MDAEEVNLDHLGLDALHNHPLGYRGDDAHELPGLARLDAEVEAGVKVGGADCPAEERLGVIETEHVVVVLHVVAVQELVDVLQLE